MTFDGRLLSGVTVFAAVAEAGSFARAAEAMGLSPSGVSRAISRLEARLRVRLFDRNTRSMTLTDEGRRFHTEVRSHLDAIEDAAAVASGTVGTVHGRLRVNVDPYFSRTFLSRHLAGFLNRYPDLRVELIGRDEVGELVGDGFDLAVRFGDPPQGSLVAAKLFETRVLTVASAGYIARHGRPGHPRDVAGHRRILFFDPVGRRPFGWEFRRPDEVVEIAAEGHLLVSDVETMLQTAAAGAGIAQVLDIGIGDLLADGRLVDLFPDWPGERFPLYALYPSRRHIAAKVRAFVDLCREALKPRAA